MNNEQFFHSLTRDKIILCNDSPRPLEEPTKVEDAEIEDTPKEVGNKYWSLRYLLTGVSGIVILYSLYRKLYGREKGGKSNRFGHI